MSRINGEAPASASPASARERDAPRLGTDARFVYDVLREHAGRPIPEGEWRALNELVPNVNSSIGYLKRAYGLEVRRRALVSEPGSRVKLVLISETDERVRYA